MKSTIKGWGIIRLWKPDLIHAHFAVPAGAAAYPLSKITGVPYILTIHGGDVPDAAPEKTAKWFRMIYPFSKAIWMNATWVIAVSEYVKELAEKRYDVPIQVIGNRINLTQFAPMKQFWKFQPLKPIYPNPLQAFMIFYIACVENV